MEEFILTHFNNILLISGGVCLILLIIIIIICCFSPSCYLYKKFHKSDLLKSVEARRKALYGDEVVLAAFPGMNMTEIKKNELVQRSNSIISGNSTSSAYSSKRQSGSSVGKLSIAASSLHDSLYEHDMGSVQCIDMEQIYDNPQHPHPVLTLNLYLTVISEDSYRLFITFGELKGLPQRQYGSGAVDAYLIIKIISSPSTILLDTRTRTIRRTNNPIYQETFHIDVKRTEDLMIDIKGYDQDRHANPTLLCKAQLNLAAYTEKLLKCLPQNIEFIMNPAIQETRGEILLSITYLPTAQRITFTIQRVQGLISEDLDSDVINPYIRIILLTSSGRSLRRKKTGYQINSITPTFSESVTFDILPGQLESVTFLVTVCHKVTPDITDSESDQNININDISNLPNLKDVCLGKVALGKNVRGTAQKLHWMSVLQNPRKVLTHWHSLH